MRRKKRCPLYHPTTDIGRRRGNVRSGPNSDVDYREQPDFMMPLSFHTIWFSIDSATPSEKILRSSLAVSAEMGGGGCIAPLLVDDLLGESMRSVVASVVAAAVLFAASSVASASGLLSPAPIALQKAGRFDGWFIGGYWANPLDTFKADHDTNPLSSAKLTGSLLGVNGGRGFQKGMFFYGFSARIGGGVLEGQVDGVPCPNNCYTSLNVLGEATLSAGVVFWQRILVFAGIGPNFAIMRSGQTLYGLNDQFVSGVHGTLGAKVAVDDHWQIGMQIERVRVGDLYYNTPTGHVGVNPHDFWLLTAGFEYQF
jgi:opacity protein-like surface antigen